MNVEEREMKDDEALVTSSICLIDSNLSEIRKELFVHKKLSDNGTLPINDIKNMIENIEKITGETYE